ncbi:MAG TPA: trifunctional transcriptional activator/DNA repair protein Ada/methylated-DNA--[protein]-cysteine S-methyltransferase [Longimicrobiales bacterium]|nr:trifunctional transcriptional activator/DNA repair protein Ada/methylated-DNA--[protein]-cysteine S-methyltransferase [Longimicrobiales bacterium]
MQNSIAAAAERDLPSGSEMWRAFTARDGAYDGVFFTGVRSTGIFCRPTCPARKPLRENVEFFGTAADALFAGYRPCKRCRPLEPRGEAPAWLSGVLERIEREPARRVRDGDLRDAGLDPARVRRWFKAHHGMTFQAYQRARRLGRALGQLSLGDDIVQTAYRNGFESLSGFNDAIRRLAGESPGRVRETTVVHLTRIPTPLGPMLAGATDDALCLLEFAERRMLETQLRRVRRQLGAVLVPGETEITRRTAEELERYFAGTLRDFDLPLATAGTAFQEDVWAELRTIPYGETRSYGEQARRIGRAGAVRAVARANGDNRIAIIIPCHRVIGADGKLTGYGGGLWRKKRLLELERGEAQLGLGSLGSAAER